MRRFRSDERGAVTIAFALWFPLVAFIFFAILDFAYAFTVNASMWQQTRVAARGMSMFELTESEARHVIQHGLSWSQKDFEVDIASDRRTVTVSVSTPYSKLGITNTAMRMIGGDWVTRVTMLKEPV
ncbi:hypothetical protein ATO6_12515 [Oceanicola sp. 22II-s10i]|uniref:TadE/TadG family type IV pilus assembly protein n=1 Tax=Oceanicola sp. 22II-s10i TaxID=1317116 RepID=UPI000B526E90|nr:TadE/TadG family type IV pilus assembly protein [Oceanicola sp. 22II-s10i]OWU84502.1 hypothetical protein ATO6_12515 [Oceanicola sp. 22II-s10i]